MLSSNARMLEKDQLHNMALSMRCFQEELGIAVVPAFRSDTILEDGTMMMQSRRQQTVTTAPTHGRSPRDADEGDGSILASQQGGKRRIALHNTPCGQLLPPCHMTIITRSGPSESGQRALIPVGQVVPQA
jgi:hypothetical protein